jgi:hypothetical protein
MMSDRITSADRLFARMILEAYHRKVWRRLLANCGIEDGQIPEVTFRHAGLGFLDPLKKENTP